MRKNMLGAITIIMLIIFISGCPDNNAANPVNVKTSATLIAPVKAESNVIDYGNGVYYFPFNGADFGNALSAFIKDHPELEVATMAPDDTAGYGCTYGYFVVFKSRV